MVASTVGKATEVGIEKNFHTHTHTHTHFTKAESNYARMLSAVNSE